MRASKEHQRGHIKGARFELNSIEFGRRKAENVESNGPGSNNQTNQTGQARIEFQKFEEALGMLSLLGSCQVRERSARPTPAEAGVVVDGHRVAWQLSGGQAACRKPNFLLRRRLQIDDKVWGRNRIRLSTTE